MESPFIYNKYVTGKNFIGRKGDITILGNLMSAGENISIYEPPRSGKTSAIQQAFFNMRIQGKRFAIAEVNMTATRSIGQLLLQIGDSCIRAFASTPGEFADIAGRLLQGTHLVFDPQSYAETDSILSLTWDVDDEDIRAIFRLPYRLAAENSMRLFVIIDEFQNVNLTENGDKICKILESVMKEVREVESPLCSFRRSSNTAVSSTARWSISPWVPWRTRRSSSTSSRDSSPAERSSTATCSLASASFSRDTFGISTISSPSATRFQRVTSWNPSCLTRSR